MHSANTWVKSVCDSLETEDRHLANRVLRVWLHLFRDRLTVDAAAHLPAQLPAPLRGVYYKGGRRARSSTWSSICQHPPAIRW
ncbi:DUF2267 domain-containing protein [Yinghuangia aomiensis]